MNWSEFVNDAFAQKASATSPTATRTVTIPIVSGQMSVTMTGRGGSGPFAVSNLQAVSLPGYVSGTPYYIGFRRELGSNGMASRTEIKNVSISFGNNRCP